MTRPGAIAWDRRAALLGGVLAAIAVASCASPQGVPARSWTVPRTPDGHPDLSGTYDTATLTPLERPVEFGDKLFLTEEEAAAIENAERSLTEQLARPSDPDRAAPPLGGDGTPGAGGNVGGYNYLWLDRGTRVFQLDGRLRSSIIVDPPDGRLPPLTPEAARRAAERRALYKENAGDNKGEAWWLEIDGPGPYDDPEQRSLGERCLLGFGSTSGPPSLPVTYNNLKRIVQTPDHVVILVEMVHDVRIIRLNREHGPNAIRRWMGDSVGHWEGDTLVVDTTHFVRTPGLASASENLHVIERFTRVAEDTLLYRFTVEDPTVWTRPWSGEYPWVATGSRLYEYACHEGNYSFGGILRGARVLEAEAREKGRGKVP
jgi:hypothetical protein